MVVQQGIIALILLLSISSDRVSGFPKQKDTSIDEIKDESLLKYLSAPSDPFEDEIAIVHRILERVPLIDGHNDLPDVIRKVADNQLASFNLTDLTDTQPWSTNPASHTDILRIRKGKLGAQFWVAFTNCTSQYKDAPQKALEQIDLVYRIIQLHPDTFQLATTAQEIEDVFALGKIASLIGVEGGHAIGNSLSVLRMFYRLGVRYMTLTHSCPTPWADNSQLDNPGQEPRNDGLSGFGEAVVQEMNRLGMMVDISHVSLATMSDVLNISQAPVIFSHSGAFSICNNSRNVPDKILRRLAENGGIIMVVFYNQFLTCDKSASLKDVVRHIQHIRNIIGVDYIGIGSDYNGVDSVPTDLPDVSTFPKLFVALLRQGWSEQDLEKLAGKNLLRVMRRVEQVKEELSFMDAIEEWMPTEDLHPDQKQCSTDYF